MGANENGLQTSTEETPATNLTGISDKANVYSVNSKNSPWIIDTGASDHITRNSSQTQSMREPSHSIISTANGSTSQVIGEGSITLSNTLTLDTVLVIPSLECNLLSVSQITSKLNCIVTFWPSFGVFQDILTRKVLGCGVKHGRLYHLELTENGENKFCETYHTTTKGKTKH